MAFQMPKIFGLKPQRPKRFDYQPRYYSSDRERLEKRVDRIARELEADEQARQQQGEGYDAEAFRANINTSWARDHRRTEVRKSNRIYLGVAFFLGLIVYLVFFR